MGFLEILLAVVLGLIVVSLFPYIVLFVVGLGLVIVGFAKNLLGIRRHDEKTDL